MSEYLKRGNELRCLLIQKTNTKSQISKIVYLSVKDSPDLNGLRILNTKRGIGASKELFGLKKSQHI